MHLLRTTPGGFVDDRAGVVRIEQTPADVVVMSSADTTLALLAQAYSRWTASLPAGGVPTLRLANLAFLRQPAAVDFYEDDVLRHAKVIVVDHLGGDAYWPYGIERLTALAARTGSRLAMFSGDLTEDAGLIARSTLPADVCRTLWRYLREGGPRNADGFLRYLAHSGLASAFATPEPPPPAPLPPVAIYHPRQSIATLDDWRADWSAAAAVTGGQAAMAEAAASRKGTIPAPAGSASPATVAILFYKAHLQSGNTAVFDALCEALSARGLQPLPLAIVSLKDSLSSDGVRMLCEQAGVDLILNTTSFSAASIDQSDLPEGEHVWQVADGEGLASLRQFGDVPVFQVILSSANRDDWLGDEQGLRARDVAMHIALPEVDGRVITRAISFKGLDYHCALTQSDVVRYRPDPERLAFVAELARRWCRLRTLPQADKRLALILANYPQTEGRIGNGVGLDTPASVVGILRALAEHGYRLDEAANALPTDAAALMAALTAGVTNDPQTRTFRPAWQSFALTDYQRRFAALPLPMQAAVNARWGGAEADPTVRQGRFMIAGRRWGHVFVGIQPSRIHTGQDPHEASAVVPTAGRPVAASTPDVYASYHDAEIVPTHAYLAFYWWLRDRFGIDAVVHVGKHGNLEWLPGKSVALSAECWPDVALGPLPHLYPFIVNDPGEGSQAKRRAQAVIIDHLMPPLTRAENYGPLQDLERQVDEYYEALMVDPRRASLLRKTILQTIVSHSLHDELGLPAPTQTAEEDVLLTRADAYLCELKEAQIRDGLHTFGTVPTGRQRRDTLLALARFPSGNGRGANAGLIRALADDLGLTGDGYDPLQGDPAQPWHGPRPDWLQECGNESWRHAGDTRERLERLAERLLSGLDDPTTLAAGWPGDWQATASVLRRVRTQIAPRLDASGPEEMRQLLRGLDGRFVPPGPSGAPSRGRPDVLPTGRNFYSVDTRALPTQSAWSLGLKAANQLVERHLQEQGDFPQSVALSVWGTATMRTGGDDIAQAFALLGVRPKWAAGSHRVTDFEILPVSIFNRPRIDVTLRVSGFFRDAFSNLIRLFDAAVQAVAALDEDAETNPVRARIERERDSLIAMGIEHERARQQAGWRVFGARPGTYGAGLQTVLDRGDWQNDADLGRAYQRWGAFAYGQEDAGTPASDAFGMRLRSIDTIVQNRDNQEHDVLDSADYALFQGGMTAAVRHLSGRQPAVYVGDHSRPDVPRLKTLRDEIAFVIRSRVVNPKWIDGVKRHGYKGAAELADTVDCLFAYDATARVVSAHQYQIVTDAYLHDDTTRSFLNAHNPQALQSICARMLEAIGRGLWDADDEEKMRIEDYLIDADARQEAASGAAPGAMTP